MSGPRSPTRRTLAFHEYNGGKRSQHIWWPWGLIFFLTALLQVILQRQLGMALASLGDLSLSCEM